jgi:hypothetical protein
MKLGTFQRLDIRELASLDTVKPVQKMYVSRCIAVFSIIPFISNDTHSLGSDGQIQNLVHMTEWWLFKASV